MELAYFDSEENLNTPHYLIDAELEDCAMPFGGTFLLPSIVPAASPTHYAVVLDEATGIYHVARKGTIVYKDVTKILIDECQNNACQRSFKENPRGRINTVEMPDSFNALSREQCTIMPTFGYSEEASSPSSSLSSVSIMDQFESIFTSSQGSPAAQGITNSVNIGLDKGIVDRGSLVEQVSFIYPTKLPSIISSTLSRKSADSVFFESLLARKGPLNETVSPITVSSAPTKKSADSVFFESLLNEKPAAVAAPSVNQQEMPEEAADNAFREISRTTTTKQPAIDAELVNAEIKYNELELLNTASSALSPKLEPTASWIDTSAFDLPDLACSLDLAIPKSSAKPRLLLSELNLEITPSQVYSLLQDQEYNAHTIENATKLAIECSTDDKVRYHQPVAPRQDAMAYEVCLLPRSRSWSISSSGTEAFSSVELNQMQPSTSTSVLPESEDKMFLLFEQDPLEESHWLDLVSMFHNSESTKVRAEICDEKSCLLSQSRENGQEISTGAPVIKLPWTNPRKYQNHQKSQDMPDLSIIPWSVHTTTAVVEGDHNVLRVVLPQRLSNTPSPDMRQSPKITDSALQAAIEALDIAAVFGGKSNDWSDDSDPDKIKSGDEHNPEFETYCKCAETTEPIDNDTPEIFKANRTVVGSEWSPGLKSAKTSLDVMPIDDRPPLQARYCLPARVIKAINLEYCRIWEFEGPWAAGIDEDKVYELALGKIKSIEEDIPDDILFWVREVNSEFSRLCLDDPVGGGFWNLSLQFEQAMALTLSNVEWHYFCHCLENLPKSASSQPALEAAESPRDWIVQMLGGHLQYNERSCPKTIDDDNSVVSDHHYGELRHIRNNGTVFDVHSNTPPSVSFRVACATRFKQLFDTYNPHGQPSPCPIRSSSFKHNGASPLAHVLSTDDLHLDTPNDEAIKHTLTDFSGDSDIDDNVNIKELAAPVTPALLLRLPNRVDNANYVRTITADGEMTEDAASSDGSVSEADTEIQDAYTLASSDPVNYYSNDRSDVEQSTCIDQRAAMTATALQCLSGTIAHQDRDMNDLHMINNVQAAHLVHYSEDLSADSHFEDDYEWSNEETLLLNQERRHDDAAVNYGACAREVDGSYTSLRNAATAILSTPCSTSSLDFNTATPPTSEGISGAPYQSRKTATSEEVEDHLSAGNTPFVSKLRRHGFFSVTSPQLLALSVKVFPAQTAMQGELDKIVEDLPDLSSDDEGDAEIHHMTKPQKLVPREPTVLDLSVTFSGVADMEQRSEGEENVGCDNMIRTEVDAVGDEAIDVASSALPLTL